MELQKKKNWKSFTKLLIAAEALQTLQNKIQIPRMQTKTTQDQSRSQRLMDPSNQMIPVSLAIHLKLKNQCTI